MTPTGLAAGWCCVAAAAGWLVLGWPYLTWTFKAARQLWRETPAAAGKEART